MHSMTLLLSIQMHFVCYFRESLKYSSSTSLVMYSELTGLNVNKYGIIYKGKIYKIQERFVCP